MRILFSGQEDLSDSKYIYRRLDSKGMAMPHYQSSDLMGDTLITLQKQQDWLIRY